MNTKPRFSSAVLALGLSLLLFPVVVAAQTAGRVDFTARVSPTGGRPEPVRQLTFYLLSKSLDDIRTEALKLEPPPDLDKFVDDLKVSPEMKAWMKKRHSVRLVGGDFVKSLTPDDIVDVPEFFEAYMMRNSGFKGVGFPEPKYKEKDKEANPEKYKAQKEEYIAAIRKFIDAVPESVQGLDADMEDINPFERWQHLVFAQRQQLAKKTIELAQQRYLAAQADTDLDGHGAFAGLAPSTYWIGMIGTEAISGDVHLDWDVPVTVRPGETTHVELSNLNATKPNTTADNSIH
jgi:hypothetical protein